MACRAQGSWCGWGCCRCAPCILRACLLLPPLLRARLSLLENGRRLLMHRPVDSDCGNHSRCQHTAAQPSQKWLRHMAPICLPPHGQSVCVPLVTRHDPLLSVWCAVPVVRVLTPPTGLPHMLAKPVWPVALLHSSRPGSARRCCRNDQAGAVGGGLQLPPLHCVRYLPCMPVACMCAVCCCAQTPHCAIRAAALLFVFRSGVWGCPVSCTKLHTRQPQDIHTHPTLY